MSNISKDKIYGVDASEENTRLLRIKVLCATNLLPQNFVQESESGDCYVKVLLQNRAERNQTIDIARTRIDSKTLNHVWNQEFIFRVDPTKHRLIFQIYNQNKLTRDEFLGMFYVDLDLNIPNESTKQPLLTKDYKLLKRSVLQRAGGSATIALGYINLDAETKSETVNNDDLVEPSLPSGWTERKDASGRTYYVDHNTRTTSWTRPNLNEQNTDDERPLPSGWQMSKTDGGRLFFIDMINKRTTWIDPRTPSIQRDADETTELPEHWEKRTSPDGRVYYIDHVNKTTTWTDPRLPKPTIPDLRDYETKCRSFRRSLPQPKSSVDSAVELLVHRKDILETSFQTIMNIKDVGILKIKPKIVFDDERDLDNNDLIQEWFSILSRELFNPYYALFEHAAIDNYTLQINPLSGMFNEEHINYFRFVGRFIAMAIYHEKLLQAFFICPFYKMLLSKSITLADIKSIDREYYKSLKYIVDNDPAELDLNFVITEEILGELREHELKPDGQKIPVTEQNKHEYIELIINHKFVQCVTIQMNALKTGFQEIFSLDCLKIFDENEIERLISGHGEINVNDWKTHTIYKGGYTADGHVIESFWKAVDSFSIEERKQLLKFVIGTSRLPINGFRDLWSSSGPQLFNIVKWGTPANLPRAVTSFNRLDLPPYESYSDLRRKLIQAIEFNEANESVD